MKNNEKTEICCINTLNKHNIPRDNLAFRGYAEDALCIEKAKFGYSSYYGYHGRKMDRKWNLTFAGAIRRNLKKIAESDSEEKKMLKDFNAELKFYNL